MNENDVLLGQIQDKYNQCQGRNVITSTDFLDLNQQTVAMEFVRTKLAGQGVFFGGYEDAERRKLIFLPDYIEADSEEELIKALEENDVMRLLEIKRPKEGMPLGHRDYLGSLMGEGVKREKIGDILVTEDGAKIIVSGEMADYLLDNYSMAGRVSLTVSIGKLEDAEKVEAKTKEIRDTVPSLRLDAVLASAFGISRSKAAEAIKMGIVFVNSSQVTKADKQVAEGDRLVIRGKGKAKLREVSGKSKKDRTYILIDRYI